MVYAVSVLRYSVMYHSPNKRILICCCCVCLCRIYGVPQVHAKGSFYDSPDELLRQVTGEPLRPMALVDHLRDKYTDIYGLGQISEISGV